MSLLGKLWEANSMDLVCVVDRSFLILGVVRLWNESLRLDFVLNTVSVVFNYAGPFFLKYVYRRPFRFLMLFTKKKPIKPDAY